jgi:CDP-4-dehydro-6-deoxyglucose reductase
VRFGARSWWFDFLQAEGRREVYVCGSVKMVEAAVPAFITHGLAENLCFSDAFVPSPNPPAATSTA